MGNEQKDAAKVDTGAPNHVSAEACVLSTILMKLILSVRIYVSGGETCASRNGEVCAIQKDW